MGDDYPEVTNQPGDLLYRRRMVSDMLTGGVEYRKDDTAPWYFGALTVRPVDGEEEAFVAKDPDGDRHKVEVPDTNMPEKVDHVEAGLRACWEEFMEEL